MATCSEKTWKALVEIMESRKATKSREGDLVRQRNELKEKLLELGAGSSEKHLRTSRDYTNCLFEIELMRARIKTLGDKFEGAVQAGIQGELFDFDLKDFSIKISEAELFEAQRHHDDEDEEEEVGGRQSKLPLADSDGINKGATFPGEFIIARADGAGKQFKIAQDREQLNDLIELALGGPCDKFDFGAGQVFVKDAVVLKVTFKGPAGKPEEKQAGVPKASKRTAKGKKPDAAQNN